MKKFLMAMTAMTMITTTVNAESYNNNTTVRGTVVNSVPHYHTKTVKVPSTKCTIKDVPIYSKNKANAGEGALAGMIIGGILGKAIGGNDGGAAAGAILGGVIGADKAGDKPGREVVGYRQEESCRTVHANETRKVQSGWTTTVEYGGATITEKTNRRFYAGQTVIINLSASIQE
jgi:uncharacterized protein YcfJ